MNPMTPGRHSHRAEMFRRPSQMASWHSERGFSLIELMTVVSMIGLLTSIALPNFLSYWNRARQSEARTNLPLIVAYEMAYKLRHGTFLACPTNPEGPRQTWNRQDACWKKLGFSLTGLAPLYQYQVGLKDNTIIVRATGNLDDDATLDVWEVTGGGSPFNLTDDVGG